MSLRSWGFSPPSPTIVCYLAYFMTDLNTDDIFDQIAPEREGRSKKKLPKGLLRLIVALAAIVVVAVVIVVLVTSLTGRDETAEYQSYMNSVESMLERSDAVGGQVAGLLMEPGTLRGKRSRPVWTRLSPPRRHWRPRRRHWQSRRSWSNRTSDQFFVLVMHFRAQGMADLLKPSLMNAPELQDVEVPSEQISPFLTYPATRTSSTTRCSSPR